MNYQFRKIKASEIPVVWNILQKAIQRRKEDGSNQWQNGYPNLDTVKNDFEKDVGFVLADGDKILAYAAILINDEPAYAEINGQWLTNTDFVVVHRVAVAEEYLGKGLIQYLFREIEKYSLNMNIHSIKVDTNFDNLPMLKIVEKLGYSYCGEVFFSGSPRKAFEKVI